MHISNIEPNTYFKPWGSHWPLSRPDRLLAPSLASSRSPSQSLVGNCAMHISNMEPNTYFKPWGFPLAPLAIRQAALLHLRKKCIHISTLLDVHWVRQRDPLPEIAAATSECCRGGAPGAHPGPANILHSRIVVICYIYIYICMYIYIYIYYTYIYVYIYIYIYIYIIYMYTYVYILRYSIVVLPAPAASGLRLGEERAGAGPATLRGHGAACYYDHHYYHYYYY